MEKLKDLLKCGYGSFQKVDYGCKEPAKNFYMKMQTGVEGLSFVYQTGYVSAAKIVGFEKLSFAGVYVEGTTRYYPTTMPCNTIEKQFHRGLKLELLADSIQTFYQLVMDKYADKLLAIDLNACKEEVMRVTGSGLFALHLKTAVESAYTNYMSNPDCDSTTYIRQTHHNLIKKGGYQGLINGESGYENYLAYLAGDEAAVEKEVEAHCAAQAKDMIEHRLCLDAFNVHYNDYVSRQVEKEKRLINLAVKNFGHGERMDMTITLGEASYTFSASRDFIYNGEVTRSFHIHNPKVQAVVMEKYPQGLAFEVIDRIEKNNTCIYQKCS